MRLKVLIGFCCCLSFLPSPEAQTNAAKKWLSLKECIDLSLENNLALKAARLSPTIARFELKAAYGAYDPVLSLSGIRRFDDQPATFDPRKLNSIRPPLSPAPTNITGSDLQYTAITDSAGPSLDGRLPFGLRYGLYGRSEFSDATTYPLGWQAPLLAAGGLPANSAMTNNYYATAGIVLSQPLLKDFWIDPYRRDILLNKKNLKISELALRDQLITSVTAVIKSYSNLAFAREEIRARQQELELATTFLDYIRKKIGAGELPPLDEAQAAAHAETARTALFAAEAGYIEQQNLLKNLIFPEYKSWADIQLEPTDTLAASPEAVEREQSWQRALTHRPDLLEMKANLEKHDILVRFNSNQRLPSLNLQGSYGWQEVEPGFSATVNDLRNGSQPFYTVGAVLSFPIGNVTARNNYKASKAARAQALVLFQKEQQDILAQVDTAIKIMEMNLKQVASARKAREFAGLALAAEEKKFNAGESTSFLVMEYQTRLTQARSLEARALADYNIAKAQFRMAEGTTLENNGINVKLEQP